MPFRVTQRPDKEDYFLANLHDYRTDIEKLRLKEAVVWVYAYQALPLILLATYFLFALLINPERQKTFSQQINTQISELQIKHQTAVASLNDQEKLIIKRLIRHQQISQPIAALEILANYLPKNAYITEYSFSDNKKISTINGYSEQEYFDQFITDMRNDKRVQLFEIEKQSHLQQSRIQFKANMRVKDAKAI